MITKKFGVDFFSEYGALTLRHEDIGTHEDGWTITGEVHEDYFEWVNDFEAVHKKYGKVWGNFEVEVYADNKEGFKHFYRHHTPEAWDYGDI